MNIAVLAPEAILPANTGGRIVIYNKIKYLSKLGDNIYLFCITDSDEESKALVRHSKEIVTACFAYNRNNNKKTAIIRTFKYPYAIASRINDDLIRDLRSIYRKDKIDLIDIEFPQMAENIILSGLGKKVKCVLSEHNIEYKSMHSIALSIKNPLKRAIYLFDAHRLRSYEEILIKSGVIDGYTFVSSDDMKVFQKEYKNQNAKCRLAPIGAEDYKLDAFSNPRNIVIVGKMSYQPNVEGVLWFCNKVWPIVREKCKDTNLFIVGKDPDQSLLDIKDSRIEVTGTVDSVEPYYEQSCVAVIPIFAGGGVKTKLIEASSHAMPIVCTPDGIIGTNYKNKEHCFVSDDATEFAGYVIDAINGSEGSMKAAEKAYKLFMETYTWEGICNSLQGFFEEISGE